MAIQLLSEISGSENFKFAKWKSQETVFIKTFFEIIIVYGVRDPLTGIPVFSGFINLFY